MSTDCMMKNLLTHSIVWIFVCVLCGPLHAADKNLSFAKDGINGERGYSLRVTETGEIIDNGDIENEAIVNLVAKLASRVSIEIQNLNQ